MNPAATKTTAFMIKARKRDLPVRRSGKACPLKYLLKPTSAGAGVSCAKVKGVIFLKGSGV